jgi:hypothetical protein
MNDSIEPTTDCTIVVVLHESRKHWTRETTASDSWFEEGGGIQHSVRASLESCVLSGE